MLAPLGVLLPNGLGLNVDGKDIGRAYFVRCFQDGCYAEVILEEPLLGTLKSGKSATFIVFQTPEEGVGGYVRHFCARRAKFFSPALISLNSYQIGDHSSRMACRLVAHRRGHAKLA